MKNSLVVVLLGLALLAAFSVSGVHTNFESDNKNIGVYEHYLDIQTDKGVFSLGEDIELDIILFNNGDSPKTYKGSGSGHRANVWIENSNGVEVWNNVPEFQDMDYDEITVPANSNFFLQTVIWSQANQDGEQVAPGTYTIISQNDHTPAETGVLTITIDSDAHSDRYVDIVTEKTIYSSGEMVEMELSLVNNGDQPQTYEGSGSSHRASVWIYDSEGEEVWNNIPDCQTEDWEKITVDANSKHFLQTAKWPQVNQNGDAVPPGTYKIIAENDHSPVETCVLTIIIE
jgi:hypothetical protein